MYLSVLNLGQNLVFCLLQSVVLCVQVNHEVVGRLIF